MASATLEPTSIAVEWCTCAESPAYFVGTYCRIYDPQVKGWVPFTLWPAQVRTLRSIHQNQLSIILKSRQLGISWLAMAYALYLMIFQPVATISIFSRREEEAVYMLGTDRMRGMYKRLPGWMKVRDVVTDNDKRWELSTGSVARAFPTTSGDGYVNTLAIADEFDLVEDQDRLMNAVKPTISAGGKMILLSRPDKARPQTFFKQTYRAAIEHENNWSPIFLPWNARPDRTQAWYEGEVADSLSSTGSLDSVYEQYPATEEEALSPLSLNKRIAEAWLKQCYERLGPLELPFEAPPIPELKLFRLPVYGHNYVIGADPAQGNPTSDDSSATVLDRVTGEEVASIAGKFQPAVFASHISLISAYFYNAAAMVERNNHGHAVIMWLADHAGEVPLLAGHDNQPGWHSTSVGKALLYNTAADAFRERDTRLHNQATYLQLASIEGATLRAPEGEMDDLADGYALALVGRSSRGPSGGSFNYAGFGNKTEEDY
jgi:hypothetical protein